MITHFVTSLAKSSREAVPLRIRHEHPHCELQVPPPNDRNEIPASVEQAGSQVLVTVGNARVRVLQIAISRTKGVSPSPEKNQKRRLLPLRDSRVNDVPIAVSLSLMAGLTRHRERIEKHEVSGVPPANVVYDVPFSIEYTVVVFGGKDSALKARCIESESGKHRAENAPRVRTHLVELDEVLPRRGSKPLSIQDSRSRVPTEAGRVGRPDSQRLLRHPLTVVQRDAVIGVDGLVQTLEHRSSMVANGDRVHAAAGMALAHAEPFAPRCLIQQIFQHRQIHGVLDEVPPLPAFLFSRLSGSCSAVHIVVRLMVRSNVIRPAAIPARLATCPPARRRGEQTPVGSGLDEATAGGVVLFGGLLGLDGEFDAA